MASAFVREKLKGQVVYFCCGSTVRWLFERGRVGHRRIRRLSGFFGLQVAMPAHRYTSGRYIRGIRRLPKPYR